MGRTNIDLDEAACRAVMRRYGLPSKREAVNVALRQLAGELSVEQACQLKGSGWAADLDRFRTSRTADP
jgi:Arc/MetJ family transcription regulator